MITTRRAVVRLLTLTVAAVLLTGGCRPAPLRIVPPVRAITPIQNPGPPPGSVNCLDRVCPINTVPSS